MNNRKTEIKRFLEAEVDSMSGFVIELAAIFSRDKLIDPGLVESISLHINNEKNKEKLSAYTFSVADKSSGNYVFLIATSKGIYAFSMDDFSLEYFIDYPNIGSIDFSRNGIFNTTYVMSICMMGEKDYGWFFECPYKPLLVDFARKAQAALVAYKPIEDNAISDDSISNEELINRINTLYNIKLITKKDRDLKIRYLP
jgi:hypothetical protein